jgi:hypothetical protein
MGNRSSLSLRLTPDCPAVKPTVDPFSKPKKTHLSGKRNTASDLTSDYLWNELADRVAVYLSRHFPPVLARNLTGYDSSWSLIGNSSPRMQMSALMLQWAKAFADPVVSKAYLSTSL